MRAGISLGAPALPLPPPSSLTLAACLPPPAFLPPPDKQAGSQARSKHARAHTHAHTQHPRTCGKVRRGIPSHKASTAVEWALKGQVSKKTCSLPRVTVESRRDLWVPTRVRPHSGPPRAHTQERERGGEKREREGGKEGGREGGRERGSKGGSLIISIKYYIIILSYYIILL